MDGTLVSASDFVPVDDTTIEQTSSEYLGRWNRLVSSTNWEKGRIICEWREELSQAGAAATSYSDDAWSRQVGSVTPQHTGRLRRVHQRFATVRETFPGLYWSHFQAALDWDDAEMWLEGAVQNGWSISQMQGERARTLGALIEENVEVAAVDIDEDSAAAPYERPSEDLAASASHSASEAPMDEVAAIEFEQSSESAPFEATERSEEETSAVRPFENLPQLPADLRDAFDIFKLAIIHHRIAAWQDTSVADVLATLDALRQLALAPAEA